MSIFIVGPVAATKNNKGNFVNIPIGLQGDWVNTQEGQDKLREAAMCALDGTDIQHTKIDRLDENRIVIRVPCDSWTDAISRAPNLKNHVAIQLKATTIEPVIDR